VVTGAGQGIGEAIALTFSREGAHLALYEVNMEAARLVAHKIQEMGRNAFPVACDISDIGQVSRATAQVVDVFGGVDYLANNAGVGQPCAATEVTETLWDRTRDINLKGTFFCCQEVGKHMIAQGGGVIINMVSTQAHVGAPGHAVYAASKGGILALTRVLAVRMGAAQHQSQCCESEPHQDSTDSCHWRRKPRVL